MFDRETKSTPHRRHTSLTDAQERFVLRYLVDFDRLEALREAGYGFTTEDTGHSMASRLLSNVKVRAFIVEKKAEWAAEYKMDALRWMAHLQLIALEAYEGQDWAGAVSALREIGRHLGMYEKDNRQKVLPSKEEADRIEADLCSRGLDLRRVNAPARLQRPIPATNGTTGEHS